MSKNNNSKMVQGISAEDYFATVIGPLSISIMEKCLYKFHQTDGEGMTAAELKLVQFGIERTYGSATRRTEVMQITDQEIVAEQLGSLDEETLRQIASINAPRDGGHSVN